MHILIFILFNYFIIYLLFIFFYYIVLFILYISKSNISFFYLSLLALTIYKTELLVSRIQPPLISF